jgi:hypothetical protein
MIPADVLVSHTLAYFPRVNTTTHRFLTVSWLTFTVLNAAAVVVGFMLLQELGFTVNAAVAGALALLFGSTFLWYSQKPGK